MIGIISYLPTNLILRNKRKKAMDKQLKFLTDLFPNETINVVAQGFNEDEYSTLPNINYIKYSEPLGPAKARNILFKMFYDSDEDILLFGDDDIIIYDYYDATQLITDFYYQKRYADEDIDIILPSSPIVRPFKKVLYEKYDTENNHVLVKSNISTAFHLCLMRNLKKKYGFEKYFDETIDLFSDSAIPEDVWLVHELILAGVKIYRCENWIENNLGYSDSTLYLNEANYALHKRNNVNLEKKLAEKGLTIRQLTALNKALPLKYLKRPEPYTIPENLKPKTTKRKLF